MAHQRAFDPHMFLAKVGVGRTIMPCHKQRPIFTQGEPADAVFYIQDGQVKLTVVSARGKEAVIAILEAKTFFGEGCLSGQPLRMATATALTACTLMRIKAAMLQVLQAEPAFSALFMAYLLSRNSRIEADLIDQLFNASAKRLARALLLLAHFGKDGQEEPVMPRISQETAATHTRHVRHCEQPRGRLLCYPLLTLTPSPHGTARPCIGVVDTRGRSSQVMEQHSCCRSHADGAMLIKTRNYGNQDMP